MIKQIKIFFSLLLLLPGLSFAQGKYDRDFEETKSFIWFISCNGPDARSCYTDNGGLRWVTLTGKGIAENAGNMLYTPYQIDCKNGLLKEIAADTKFVKPKQGSVFSEFIRNSCRL
jgi:hypothetical protein